MFLPDELIFMAPERPVLAFAEGGFARSVLVLTLEEPQASGNRDFLAKILSAAQLNLAQDTLLASVPADERLDLPPLLREKPAKQVLVFGLSASQIGLTLNTRPYQPFSFYGATWLFADSLAAIASDQAKKSLLWSALKGIFL